MKRFFLLSVLFFLPSLASAHVKWFASPQTTNDIVMNENAVRLGLYIGVGVLFLAIVVACILERFLPDISTAWKNKGKRLYPHALSIFRVLVGLWLVLSAYMGGIFAPNLAVHGDFREYMQMGQALIGLWLMTGVGVRYAAGALLLLYFIAMIPFGVLPLLDHIGVIGIALFLGIAYSEQEPWYNTWHPWALPLLRVFTGMGLMILAFSEKLLDISLGLQFLNEHQWNFMDAIGLDWFTNTYFIIAAGISELLFGLLFVLGLVTRINTIAVTFFFTSTLFLLGPTELIGHLPFFGIALLLTLYGAGEHLTLKHALKRS